MPHPSSTRTGASTCPPTNWRGKAFSGHLLTAFLAFALGFACFAPRFVMWSSLPLAPDMPAPDVSRAGDFLRQIADPFGAQLTPPHIVIRWRLLPALIAHILHLPAAAALALPHLGAVLALLYASGVLARSIPLFLPRLAGITLLATSSWFFVSTGWLGYFDSWYVLGLLIVCFSDSRWGIVCACVLAPWIDERFILALPLALSVRLAARNATGSSLRTLLRTDVASQPALLCAAGFVIVRLLLLKLAPQDETLQFSDGLLSRTLFITPSWHYVLGLWEGFRFGWLILAAALGFLFVRRPRPAAILLAMTIGTLVVNLLMAEDISRSTSVIAPLFVASLAWFVEFSGAKAGSRMIVLLAVLNLCVPAQHVTSRWIAPINRLPTELGRWRSPDSPASRTGWVEMGYEFIVRKEYRGSDAIFSFVIQRNPSEASAWHARALTRALRHDWKSARTDIETAISMSTPSAQQHALHASILDHLGEAKDAIAAQRQAIALIPLDTPAYTKAIATLHHLESRAAGTTPPH